MKIKTLNINYLHIEMSLKSTFFNCLLELIKVYLRHSMSHFAGLRHYIIKQTIQTR